MSDDEGPLEMAPEVDPYEVLEMAIEFFNSSTLLSQPDYDNPVVAWASEQGVAGLGVLRDALTPDEYLVVAFFQMMRDYLTLLPSMRVSHGIDPASALVSVNAMSTLPQVLIRSWGVERVPLAELEAMFNPEEDV